MSKASSKDDENNKGDQTDKLRVETAMTRAETAAYFEALARGIREGELTLRQGGAEMAVSVGELPTVKVKASRKKHAGSLEITVAWKEN